MDVDDTHLRDLASQEDVEHWLRVAKAVSIQLKHFKHNSAVLSSQESVAALIAELKVIQMRLDTLTEVVKIAPPALRANTANVNLLRTAAVSFYNEARLCGAVTSLPKEVSYWCIMVRQASCALLDVVSCLHTPQATLHTLQCWCRIAAAWEAHGAVEPSNTCYSNALECLQKIGGIDKLQALMFGAELQNVCQAAFDAAIALASTKLRSGTARADSFALLALATSLEGSLANSSRGFLPANTVTLSSEYLFGAEAFMRSKEWSTALAFLDEGIKLLTAYPTCEAPNAGTDVISTRLQHLRLCRCYCNIETIASTQATAKLNSQQSKVVSEIISVCHAIQDAEPGSPPALCVYLLSRAHIMLGATDAAETAILRLISLGAAGDAAVFPLVLTACGAFADSTHVNNTALVCYSAAANAFRSLDHARSLRIDLLSRMVTHEGGKSAAAKQRALKFLDRILEEHRDGKVPLAADTQQKQIFDLITHAFIERYAKDEWEDALQWAARGVSCHSMFDTTVVTVQAIQPVWMGYIACSLRCNKQDDACREAAQLAALSSDSECILFCCKIVAQGNSQTEEGRQRYITMVRNAASKLTIPHLHDLLCESAALFVRTGDCNIRDITISCMLKCVTSTPFADHCKLNPLAHRCLLDAIAQCLLTGKALTSEVCEELMGLFNAIAALWEGIEEAKSCTFTLDTAFSYLRAWMHLIASLEANCGAELTLAPNKRVILQASDAIQRIAATMSPTLPWPAELLHALLLAIHVAYSVGEELSKDNSMHLQGRLQAARDALGRMHPTFAAESIASLPSDVTTLLQQLVRVLAGRMGVTAHASMNEAWLTSLHSTMATLQSFLQLTTAANERTPVDAAQAFRDLVAVGVSLTDIEWLANTALATSEAAKKLNLDTSLLQCVLMQCGTRGALTDSDDAALVSRTLHSLLEKTASCMECLPLLEQFGLLVQANLLAAAQSSLTAQQLISVEVVDYAICKAWNHGVLCFRCKWNDAAARFFGWSINMLNPLRSLVQCRLALDAGSALESLISLESAEKMLKQYQQFLDLMNTQVSAA